MHDDRKRACCCRRYYRNGVIMELRWLKIIDVYKGYDSRWDEEYTKEYPREPMLQYRENETDDWKEVPIVEQKQNTNF